MTRNALRVSSRCEVAREAGVSIGMPLAEARTVLGNPVDAIEHDSHRDRERLRELAVACRRFSPVCGVENEDSPDGLLLDIAGCGHLFGSNQALGQQAITMLFDMGYRVKAGIGQTVGIAWAAARTVRDNDRVLQVSPSRQTEWLDRQPVGALRVNGDVVEGLTEFDLRTVGQIRRLPRSQLPSRFGNELLARLDQADGVRPEPIAPVLPLETPRAHWRSEYPLRRPDLVEVILERLLGRLADELSSGIGVTKLAVAIAAGSKEVEFETSFSRPTREPKRFVDLVSLHLERLVLPSSIDQISVRATDLNLITKSQTDLFGNLDDGESERELHDLIEQLTGRLGRDNVCYARLTPDPLPERSTELSPAIAGQITQSSPSPPLFTRPTSLLEDPDLIQVWTLAGEPARIQHNGNSHNVVRLWGPERMESGWWRDDEQLRDYYRAEIETGECLWVFWDAESARWFLHGVF